MSWVERVQISETRNQTQTIVGSTYFNKTNPSTQSRPTQPVDWVDFSGLARTA